MNQKDFNENPIKETPELKDDTWFRLNYKETYLRLRRLIQNSNQADKEKLVQELDSVFEETAKYLNLD